MSERYRKRDLALYERSTLGLVSLVVGAVAGGTVYYLGRVLLGRESIAHLPAKRPETGVAPNAPTPPASAERLSRPASTERGVQTISREGSDGRSP